MRCNEFILFTISFFIFYILLLKEHNGKSILGGIKFDSDNINLLGTKLLGILFTTEELLNGTVEPGERTDYPPLDISRVNMIKGKF